jgi:putative phosphoesterase
MKIGALHGEWAMMMRISVVSDTHELGNGWGTPSEVLDALQGSDLILHCGDLETLGVLDHLETVAPVRAVRGYGDPHEPGDRLAERIQVVEAAGVRIGMIHDLGWPGPPIRFEGTLEFPSGSVRGLLERKFGQMVDVVCFGDTHEEYIGWYQGVLWLNPGSPTHPGLRHGPGELGTLAHLEINSGVISVQLRKLYRNV